MSRFFTAMARATILAVSAMTLYLALVAPASANWFVEESELTGTAALATTAKTDQKFTLSTSGLTVECTGNMEASGPEIKATTPFAASSLIFTGCKASPSACTVPTTLGTVPVKTELAEPTVAEDRIIVKPSSGTVLATVKVSGPECSATGNKAFSGDFASLLPSGEQEESSQFFEASQGATGLLKLGSESASLTGQALFKLASDKAFAWLPDSATLSRTPDGWCKFAKKGDTCEIKFENLLTVPQIVKSVTIQGDEGTTRFKTTDNKCKPPTNVLEEKGQAGASCTDTVTMEVNQATFSVNDYCLTAENKVTGAKSNICAGLRIK